MAVVVIASLATAPPPAVKTAGLTFGDMSSEERRERRSSWNMTDILMTVLVLGLVLAVYLYFSFWLNG